MWVPAVDGRVVNLEHFTFVALQESPGEEIEGGKLVKYHIAAMTPAGTDDSGQERMAGVILQSSDSKEQIEREFHKIRTMLTTIHLVHMQQAPPGIASAAGIIDPTKLRA